MPWEKIKSPTFRKPKRKDMFIILGSLIIGLIVIAIYVFSS